MQDACRGFDSGYSERRFLAKASTVLHVLQVYFYHCTAGAASTVTLGVSLSLASHGNL